MSDLQTIWKSILEKIKKEVTPSAYNAWLKETKVDIYEGGVLYVLVQNPFSKDWIQNKCYTKILTFLREIDPLIKNVEFVIAPTVIKEKKPAQTIELDKKHDKLGQKNELPLKDHYIDLHDNLNPKYIFDTFVVGSFNELAFASAQAIIKKPGIYNPLFFYGSTGVGKTHLMQAIGNYYKNKLDKKVYYATSDRFTNDFVTSLQNNKTSQFKEKYRKYDLLIMDDIQFLSNKEKTQEELFHIFNYLYDNQKQIIFSSDQHPNYLQNLESRLKSRFSQGMIIDIPKIDTESKVAIIRSKLLQTDLVLEDSIIQYLAETLEGSIRETEGIINNISIQTDIRGRALTIDEIKEMTKDVVKSSKNTSLKDILKAVASFYKIEETSILEKNRKQEIVKPRQVLMYILREDFGYSLSSIGQKLGGRDHTTVLHACDKVNEELKSNTDLLEEITQVRSMLRV
ncbi:MAG: chromosomal replication initiator protein DnaA [Patescibacteria group bacterium]